MTDCTKIRTKLTYSQELRCIVGSTLSFDSTNVITYDDIHLKIKEIQDNKAIASQVRCIVLKIPISRIPPVVIALLLTKGDSKTQEIYTILKKVVDMSIQANINLISIGADSAITEYNAQVLLMQGNDTQEFLTYDNEIYNVHFRAPIYSGKPIICIQDPKHAKKNGRNAIHSGARFLVLGNYTVRYDQIYQLAQEENFALYMRDVINVDKQDDGAAYRVFCSTFLAQCQNNGHLDHDKSALFVYLFIFGELFDSFLNRDIYHKTRIIMAMRAYFFLSTWKNYIEQCVILHSAKWYNMNKSCISPQSFNIFCSLLILAHRNYYSNYPFFPWEYGTEALEHLFEIARQLIPDFTYYELYKVISQVQHRDNILRSENISDIQEKKSAADDDINDAIRIASENAKEFSNFLQMKKQSKNTSYTDPLIPELSETNTNNLLINEVVSQNITIDQIADELNRISQLENVLDGYFENNDISDNSCHEHSEDLLEINTADADNFIMKTEINYIINNPKTSVLQELNHEPEEKIFEKDGSCDIFLMLELQRSHEAFSRSDRPRGIQTRITVNLNQGSQDKIDRNLANHLVNQLSNNQDHQIIRSRTQRWKGRNQLQSLVNSNKMQGCANVSQAHPLKGDGYLLVFTDGRLCIAKVIAMYQMIGGKHSFVTETIYFSFIIH
ncbi:hypothetical protein RclHR1_03240002 [Rhizophagus clarus]|uniref:Uncharacterized protein n=2 Tax=Rhizophagus clarus TaxID=94130 RepID=A0A2Z6R837_9GLOM|nr:hypothetical protein RclHR1_03240002 [Rhizophagus clarus]